MTLGWLTPTVLPDANRRTPRLLFVTSADELPVNGLVAGDKASVVGTTALFEWDGGWSAATAGSTSTGGGSTVTSAGGGADPLEVQVFS